MNEAASIKEQRPNDRFANLWQQAYDASPDLISLIDTNHRVISVNTAMARAMRSSPAQAHGQYCYKLLHGIDHPPLACPHRSLMEDGREHRSEIYDEHLNMWLLVSVTPLYSEDNQLIGSIHIARDITDQKKVEQALRESEERFRHLSEATIEGVLLSEDSRIVAANQVLCEMLGYAMDDLRGMNVLKLIIPQDRTRLIDYIRNKRAGVHEFLCLRKDGTVFPIEAHSRAVTYKNGMVYQTAIRDLTEQKRIEQERATHERMQGVLEMAGAVCHEINQPLMALHGYMDIAGVKAGGKSTFSAHLEKMRHQVERIELLTRKLMRITKYETKPYAGGERIIDIDQAAQDNR